MHRSAMMIALATLTGCLNTGRQVEAEGTGSDSNNDGVDDADQSIGIGYESWNGEPYVIFFKGPHMPQRRTNIEWIGFGCSSYDNDPSDDWQVPCAPLGTYMVGGEVRGYVFTDILEDVIHQGVPVDAVSFEPNGGEGWTKASVGRKSGDDQLFFVRHVDRSLCSEEESELATHYGFERIDDEIFGLGSSIAPPDQNCDNVPNN